MGISHRSSEPFVVSEATGHCSSWRCNMLLPLISIFAWLKYQEKHWVQAYGTADWYQGEKGSCGDVQTAKMSSFHFSF